MRPSGGLDHGTGHRLIFLYLRSLCRRRPYLSCCHPVTPHGYFAAGDRDVGIRPVWSEKRVSSIGSENGKPLHFRCACHGRSPAQNRSISRNERPDTLDPCIKSIRSSNIKIQLPSFPFGCYTNPYIGLIGHGKVNIGVPVVCERLSKDFFL